MKLSKSFKILCSALLLTITLQSSAFAVTVPKPINSNDVQLFSDVPSAPTIDIFMQDYADIITTQDRQRLLASCEALYKEKGVQLEMVTITSLPDDYTLEEYSNKMFNLWGIGDKETNKGLLFVYVTSTDEIRLEVGYGLEGDIPDLAAKTILQKVHPLLRKGNYYEGFSSVITSVDGNSNITMQTGKKKVPGYIGFLVIILFILGILIFMYLLALLFYLLLQQRHFKDAHHRSVHAVWRILYGLGQILYVITSIASIFGGGKSSGGGSSFGGGSSGGGGASD